MIQILKQKPEWLKIKIPSGENYLKVKELVKKNRLNTICEEAKCPNLSECWSHGTATFLILGDVCTRYCTYCNVKTGIPAEPDFEEPKKIANAVQKLNLRYVVITSVTRDDLSDCGARIYAETVKEIKRISPYCKIELLIPDFKKRIDNKDILNIKALEVVTKSKPDVLAHNIEAVRRIFAKVRLRGDYDISLGLLKKVKEINKAMPTKSGLIIGFGETLNEIRETFNELRKSDVDFLTIGQYLQPSLKHAEIKKYYAPDEFKELKEIAYGYGFKHVESGPFVRSSYRADRLERSIA